MKRMFPIDVITCDTCGGPTRILAVLPEGEASLGIPTEPPRPCALAPPEPPAD